MKYFVKACEISVKTYMDIAFYKAFFILNAMQSGYFLLTLHFEIKIDLHEQDDQTEPRGFL